MNKKIIALIALISIVIITIFLIKIKPTPENKVSLEQKIGEMLILGFRGTEVDESSKIIQDINKYKVGGVILFDYDVPSKSFPRNIESFKQTKKLIADIKDLTNKNLFIALDAEGGYVNRLKPKYGFKEIKSAQKMGEGNFQKTFEEASRLGEELNTLGFNLNFAPSVDINSNPDNPVIGYLERSFSSNPKKVTEHAEAFIDAMHKYNVITAVKHFPGHGSSKNDSHLGLTDITETYDKESELAPYKNLIFKNKLDMIMTAHVMNRNIDDENPATLSPIFLQNILKNELKYKGIIVSDDMQMGAIADHFGFEDAILKSINAGCDLLIFSNNNREYVENITEKVVNVIKKAVEDGQIQEQRINEAYNKIKKIKQNYSL